MGGGSVAKDHPWEYLFASALAAGVNYPLWRASAIGQSGFTVSLSGNGNARILTRMLSVSPPSMAPYLYAFAPPYKGLIATVLGMTWARAAIFWGSDRGKEYILQQQQQHNNNNMIHIGPTIATIIPPLIVSTLVQCINMPIVRASITLQNPQSGLTNTMESVRYIYKNYGISGLWHGTSAGILKTVPKYCTAVIVKDYMEEYVLEQPDPTSNTYNQDRLWRSVKKSAMAGIAGAALTNPLDVIRNEMFKTNQSLFKTITLLHNELGYNFLIRGLGKNMIAVAIPVGCTIFFTDALIQMTTTNAI